MARTVNAEEHAVRRDAFVDSAARLIQTKGYERMSIQDVLDDLDVSRGAFYHYFDSKEALLEAVVDRMSEAVVASLGGVLDDPDLPAPRKLEAVFATIGSYKAARRDLVLAIFEVWLRDDNAIVREKFRRIGVMRLGPIVARILGQGAREGSMTVERPADTALVVVSLIQGLGDVAGHLFMEHQAGDRSTAEIMGTFEAWTSSLERILGLTPHSLTLLDEATLRWWFD